jgi:hypothetical protein
LLTVVEEHIDAVHTTHRRTVEPTGDPQPVPPEAALAAAGVSQSGIA